MIVLPWPNAGLSPNARLHWKPKADLKAAARADAAKEVLAQVPPCDRYRLRQAEVIPVTITFYPPDKRHRDDDNMIGSFKAARDGIADALGVNDRRFRPHYFFAEPEKPGRITVDFSPALPGQRFPETGGNAKENERGGECANTPPPLTENRLATGGD